MKKKIVIQIGAHEEDVDPEEAARFRSGYYELLPQDAKALLALGVSRSDAPADWPMQEHRGLFAKLLHATKLPYNEAARLYVALWPQVFIPIMSTARNTIDHMIKLWRLPVGEIDHQKAPDYLVIHAKEPNGLFRQNGGMAFFDLAFGELKRWGIQKWRESNNLAAELAGLYLTLLLDNPALKEEETTGQTPEKKEGRVGALSDEEISERVFELEKRVGRAHTEQSLIGVAEALPGLAELARDFAQRHLATRYPEFAGGLDELIYRLEDLPSRLRDRKIDYRRLRIHGLLDNFENAIDYIDLINAPSLPRKPSGSRQIGGYLWHDLWGIFYILETLREIDKDLSTALEIADKVTDDWLFAYNEQYGHPYD